jgi:hypothetical protein
LNQACTENLNRSISSNEIETVIKSLQPKELSEMDGFTTEYYQTLIKN